METLAYGVLCDKKVPPKLKGKFYRMVVRPTILYGAEYWPVKIAYVQKMKVEEIRMLRWMCGHTRLDRIINEVIHDKIFRVAKLVLIGLIKLMDRTIPLHFEIVRSAIFASKQIPWTATLASYTHPTRFISMIFSI
ncbi:PREDICTED: uncharacterized protein LOC109224188 [Nicotiana attenuata]|uniref:uncharacterized protein LOC109224188 n=1 Tax=Nicotiana attenuata TaxID=49451 RepID=UPI0009046D3A|nr:PREDICTED: uncharacterized protein LOC109224188 [Nicotiana attenuata]